MSKSRKPWKKRSHGHPVNIEFFSKFFLRPSEDEAKGYKQNIKG